jgi:hypothetical protein
MVAKRVTKKSESFSEGQLSYPSFTRTFKVDYFKVRGDLWRAKAQVEDPIYNVITSIDVSVPDFIIRESSVRFLIYPNRGCLRAARKIKELIRADVRGPFRDTLRREFLGFQGCDIIFNLINMSGKALAHTYLAHESALGAIKDEQYEKFYEKGLGCVVDQTESIKSRPFTAKECVCSRSDSNTSLEAATLDTDEKEPLRTRRFSVDYFELDDALWRARSEIVDFEHNFFVTLDISTADLVVRDADITFLRQPRRGCSLMKPRMKKIVGACLATDFRQRIVKQFVGAEGCPVTNCLLNGVPHGFMQFYLMRNTIMGRINPAQEALCREGLKQDCIACNL